MWNRNEGDILEETILDSFNHVDSLFIADDNSTDNSWEIIKSLKGRYPDKIEYIRNEREDPKDQGQRQSLLNEIRKRYKPQDAWVQIIESDIMILDTDIREALKTKWCRADIVMSWMTLNACKKPGEWEKNDEYPNWTKPIKEIMPYGHWMEVMTYTFRPLPKLIYNLDIWRPWPQGWHHYTRGAIDENNRGLSAPLLAHYGYRGPKHFFQKFNGKFADGFHKKYRSWDLRSVESVRNTVSFFNGEWNGGCFELSRQGWKNWRKG